MGRFEIIENLLFFDTLELANGALGRLWGDLWDGFGIRRIPLWSLEHTLGRSWGLLGPSCVFLGRSLGPLGRSLEVLGRSFGGP